MPSSPTSSRLAITHADLSDHHIASGGTTRVYRSSCRIAGAPADHVILLPKWVESASEEVRSDLPIAVALSGAPPAETAAVWRRLVAAVSRSADRQRAFSVASAAAYVAARERRDEPAVRAVAALERRRVDLRIMEIHGTVGIPTGTPGVDLPAIVAAKAPGTTLDAAASAWMAPADVLAVCASLAILADGQVRDGWFNADVKPANIMVDGTDGILTVTAIDHGSGLPIGRLRGGDAEGGSGPWNDPIAMTPAFTMPGFDRFIRCGMPSVRAAVGGLGVGARDPARVEAAAAIASAAAIDRHGRPVSASAFPDALASAFHAILDRRTSPERLADFALMHAAALASARGDGDFHAVVIGALTGDDAYLAGLASAAAWAIAATAATALRRTVGDMGMEPDAVAAGAAVAMHHGRDAGLAATACLDGIMREASDPDRGLDPAIAAWRLTSLAGMLPAVRTLPPATAVVDQLASTIRIGD